MQGGTKRGEQRAKQRGGMSEAGRRTKNNISERHGSNPEAHPGTRAKPRVGQGAPRQHGARHRTAWHGANRGKARRATAMQSASRQGEARRSEAKQSKAKTTILSRDVGRAQRCQTRKHETKRNGMAQRTPDVGCAPQNIRPRSALGGPATRHSLFAPRRKVWDIVGNTI